MSNKDLTNYDDPTRLMGREARNAFHEAMKKYVREAFNKLYLGKNE